MRLRFDVALPPAFVDDVNRRHVFPEVGRDADDPATPSPVHQWIRDIHLRLTDAELQTGVVQDTGKLYGLADVVSILTGLRDDGKLDLLAVVMAEKRIRATVRAWAKKGSPSDKRTASELLSHPNRFIKERYSAAQAIDRKA